MRKINRISLSLTVQGLLLLSAFGCSAPTLKVADAELEAKWLGFIKDGSTTKQDALLKLGLPSEHFEGERILVYRLMLFENKGFSNVSRYIKRYEPLLSEWPCGQFNLVLVFNDNHILIRHSLLKLEEYCLLNM